MGNSVILHQAPLHSSRVTVYPWVDDAAAAAAAAMVAGNNSKQLKLQLAVSSCGNMSL